ncbi:MAG: hypothetical protein GY862_35235, partial [Gammaproteobacteria bacterium]|nr:hypothetical protein [Gammaproteobacteria bacterium]
MDLKQLSQALAEQCKPVETSAGEISVYPVSLEAVAKIFGWRENAERINELFADAEKSGKVNMQQAVLLFPDLAAEFIAVAVRCPDHDAAKQLPVGVQTAVLMAAWELSTQGMEAKNMGKLLMTAMAILTRGTNQTGGNHSRKPLKTG